MRLIYPVLALVGVLAISGCAHRGGSHHGEQGFAAKNYGLTYEQVREAAQDGDADAQYALGYMYYYGQNVTRNGKQARFWIAKAASQNHQQAIRALKMMGSQPQYANRDNFSNDSARTAPMRLGDSQPNRWQEVRRPQASAEPEQFKPQAFDKENGAGKAAQEQAQANNAQTQSKKGKAVAQETAANDKHHKAQKVAELRKKHTQAALHKKDRNKQAANKKHGAAQTTAANELNQSDEATEQNQAQKGRNRAQANAQAKQGRGQAAVDSADADEATADLDDSDQTPTAPQQKTQQGQKTALKGNKQGQGQVANAKGAKLAASKGNAKLTSDERSILQAPAKNYTLQLMGSGSKAAIQKVIANNHLQQKAKVYHTTLKGKDYFVLIYGSFPSQAAANAAIAHLPANLQQLKPWAKPYANVKASIKTAV